MCCGVGTGLLKAAGELGAPSSFAKDVKKQASYAGKVFLSYRDGSFPIPLAMLHEFFGKFSDELGRRPHADALAFAMKLSKASQEFALVEYSRESGLYKLLKEFMEVSMRDVGSITREVSGQSSADIMYSVKVLKTHTNTRTIQEAIKHFSLCCRELPYKALLMPICT